MVDEMYLKKCSQYHGGEYYGENSNGVLDSGIVVFMIIGLQQSVPIVVKTLPRNINWRQLAIQRNGRLHNEVEQIWFQGSCSGCW